MNGFIEEKSGDKYLNTADTDRNSEVLKMYSEFWNGIKDCIEKINNNKSGEYDQDYIKINFNSNEDIHLNKQLNYPQSFLDECLYEV